MLPKRIVYITHSRRHNVTTRTVSPELRHDSFVTYTTTASGISPNPFVQKNKQTLIKLEIILLLV